MPEMGTVRVLHKLVNWLIDLLAATHFGARLGAFFYSTGCFENVREYRSDLSDQPALEIRVRI